MKSLAKGKRIRLDPKSYSGLHRQILLRDGWRCQICGTMQNLQVHHLKLRAQMGSDEEENLITLCAACHEGIHQRTAANLEGDC